VAPRILLPTFPEVSMVRFSNAQVPEAIQPFWAALQAGEFITDAAAQAGTYRKQGTRWVAACGGVRPRRGRDLKGRCLSFSEREEIALAHDRAEGSHRLGAHPRPRCPPARDATASRGLLACWHGTCPVCRRALLDRALHEPP